MASMYKYKGVFLRKVTVPEESTVTKDDLLLKARSGNEKAYAHLIMAMKTDVSFNIFIFKLIFISA